MTNEDQKIYEKIKKEIINEIIDDYYKIKNLKEPFKKINIDLGENLPVLSAKLKILEELKREGLIKNFKIREEETPSMHPPEKPSLLELNYDYDKATKRYELEEMAYNLYAGLAEEKYFIANIKYDPLKIKEYSKKFLKSEKNRGKIKSIFIVKFKKRSNRIMLVLNNEYLHPLEADKTTPCWDLLIRVAEKDIISAEENKAIIDYFNSNKNNRIYTRTKYKVTKILKRDGNIIYPNINIKIISEKAYKTRVNKGLKET